VTCVDFKGDSAFTPDGAEHRGAGALYAAARHLIGTGTDPTAMMVAGWEGEAPSFVPARVGYWAEMAWGGENADPWPRRWSPHPKAELPIPLLRWWQETAAARVAARVAAAKARKPLVDAKA
jgi:hypothetical protein